MKSIKNLVLVLTLFIKKILCYNESIPFNWTQNPKYCYVEDFSLSNNYRTFIKEIYPIRGCDKDILNTQYGKDIPLNNVTFYPNLDFFFVNDKYPPLDPDPPSYMTFKMNLPCKTLNKTFYYNNTYSFRVLFGRSDDYLSIPKISKKTGKPIEFIGKKV